MSVSEEPGAQEHWITQVYELLTLRGADPHGLVPNFELGSAHVILASPKTKVALATEGDSYAPLEADGWHVTRISVEAMRTFAKVSVALSELAVESRVRASASEMLKLGSTEEARLLAALVRHGVPEPNRNLRIARPDDPSREMTVPDFAWESTKVAFFVDGLWWHLGKDSDMYKQIASGTAPPEVVAAAEKQQFARATRDANSRSEMALAGWTVLSCTDEELATDQGVARQVTRIKKALKIAPDKALQAPAADPLRVVQPKPRSPRGARKTAETRDREKRERLAQLFLDEEETEATPGYHPEAVDEEP